MAVKVGVKKEQARAGAEPRAAGAPEWENASTEVTRRCVFKQIYGDTGTGRTSLALTAPGPIALLHASEKLEGIVQKAAKEKDVKLFNFGGVFKGTPQQIAQQASDRVAEFKAAMSDAYRWARTIIVDTHTESWELLRLARFGTLTPRGVVAHLYGPVNAEWRSMWKSFREQDRVNLIAIGQVQEEYRKDKPTGRMVQSGQNKFHYMADVIVRTGKSNGVFTATIEKAWWNASVEGIEVEDDMATFASIMELVTEIDAEEWS